MQTSNGFEKSGWANTGGEDRASLTPLKAASSASPHVCHAYTLPAAPVSAISGPTRVL